MIKRISVFEKILRIIGLTRWIRLGIRYRIILPLTYKDIYFEVPFFGYVYKGSLNDHIDRYVFYFGAYEKEELSLIKKYINKDSTVIDIGANTGHHSLFFSRYAKSVYSFEPYDKMFDILEKRISDNNIKNIHTFNVGIGNENKKLNFFAPVGKNNGIGSFVNERGGKSIGMLEIKKGSEALEELNLDKIDFIKIDVEGMEIEVLNGLFEIIKKYQPVLYVEMTPESQLLLQKDIIKKLEGYNFYIIDANNPFLVIFNKPGGRLKKFEPSKNTQNILFLPSN